MTIKLFKNQTLKSWAWKINVITLKLYADIVILLWLIYSHGCRSINILRKYTCVCFKTVYRDILTCFPLFSCLLLIFLNQSILSTCKNPTKKFDSKNTLIPLELNEVWDDDEWLRRENWHTLPCQTKKKYNIYICWIFLDFLFSSM